MSRFPMHTFQQDAILARLSEALVALEVSNVKQLTNEQCEKLQCGDIVVKKDSAGEHAYLVAYKKNDEMALVYCDVHNTEEVYYEKHDNAWSMVVTEIAPNVEDAVSGTIQDVLGLNSEGKLVKGTVSGGTKLYLHKISIESAQEVSGHRTKYYIEIMNNISEPYVLSNFYKRNPWESENDLYFMMYVCISTGYQRIPLFIDDGSGPGYNYQTLGFFKYENNNIVLENKIGSYSQSFTDTVTEL